MKQANGLGRLRRPSQYLLPLLLLALSGCTQLSGEAQSNPGAEPARVLEPLPEPPVIQVEQEDGPASARTLEVVSARVLNNDSGENPRPTFTFNRPIISMDMIERLNQLPPPGTITPAVAGSWRWIGSSSVEFIPSAVLPYGTLFKVVIPAGLKALDGTQLRESFTLTFETPRPTVRLELSSDFKWAAPDQLFRLNANQPLKDLVAHARLELAGQAPIPMELVKTTDVVAEEKAKARKRPHDALAESSPAGLPDRRMAYELKPARPLPLDTPFSFVLDGSLTGTEGPLALGDALKLNFRTYGPMRVREAKGCYFEQWQLDECLNQVCPCAYGPLVLTTTNPIKLETLKERISITPAVKINWEESIAPDDWPYASLGPHVILRGAFQPGTRYRIKIAAGVQDEFGQSGSAYMGELATSDVEPSLAVDSETVLIESSADGMLPVSVTNLKSLQAEVWSLKPSDLARVLKNREYRPPYPATRLTEDVTTGRNQTRWVPLDLRKINKEPRKTGFYMAMLSSPELKPEQRVGPVIAQITDLAIHAKIGASKGLAFVTRLSTGKPEVNVKVELWDEGGARRWGGVTGKDGTVFLPGTAGLLTPEYEYATPFALVTASKDDDISATLSTWDGNFWPGTMGVSTDKLVDSPDTLGFVQPDRGIYRPGDTLYFKGIARYRGIGALAAPPEGAKVKYTLTDARDQEIAAGETQISKAGSYQASVTLPKDMALGYTSLRATVTFNGQTLDYYEGVRVEEFRAPQFVIDALPVKEEVFAGEKVEADVVARYLFGGAMVGAHISWTAARSSSEFTPPDNDGFEFGMNAWWWDDSDPLPTYETFGGSEGEVNEQGTYRIDGGVAEAPGERPWTYTLEADVEDVSRQHFADRAEILVHPASAYAGVRLAGGGFAKTGQNTTLEVVAAAPDGKRLGGQIIDVTVKRREWKNIRKREPGNIWVTVSEVEETKAGECKLTSLTTPVNCTLKLDKPGYHLIEAMLTDGQGRKQLTRSYMYVVGDGWVSWQREDNGIVELVPDKTLYDIGETARILVKNPYPGASAVFTVEREGVQFAKVLTLNNATETLEVPIEEGMLPNIFVSVVLARGRVPEAQGLESGDDPGRPAVRVGYTTLNVEKKSRKLSVKLTPNAEEFRPRDTVKVQVNVADFKGQGSPAEVMLWAVDEGVLRLTEFGLPDPVQILHPSRGLRVRVAESLIHLLQRRKFGTVDKGYSVGGSGGMDSMGSDMRTEFKTTPLFKGDVETDVTGNATVSFQLPDNLTTFRIMAIASSGVELFGTAETQIKVSKPLMILPALPRLARVGDTFEAGVVVTTRGETFENVQVTTEVQGLTLLDKNTRMVNMKDGKAKEVRFTYKATQAGSASLKFAAVSGERKDGLSLRLPVQLPVVMETVAVYGETQGEQSEGLVPPGGVMADQGGLELALSSTALAGFDESMRYLIEYPYGCLEQLSSRLVPFVALRELFGKFGVKYPSAEAESRARSEFLLSWLGKEALQGLGSDPDEVVKKTIQKIESLQDYSGGYKYWPTSFCVSDYGSAYAVLALSRAKALGYQVDSEALERGKSWLADTVVAGKALDCSYNRLPSDVVTRVFALYTLARVGSPKPSYFAELSKNSGNLPLFAQAMLWDAMIIGKGNAKKVAELQRDLLSKAQETPSEVHFQENSGRRYDEYWSSDTRTTALILQTLSLVQPDHPFVTKIARYLAGVKGKDGRLRNTQESAFALMALADFVRQKEREVPDFAAQVKLADKSLLETTFKGRSMGFVKERLPTAALLEASSGAAQPASPSPLTFKKDGKGILYYSARLRYAPTEMPTTALDQGLVVQRWFEPWKGGGQSKQFEAGELIRVRVRVATPATRRYVAIEVPVPAGLEIVDTSLASTASLGTSMANEGMDMEYYGEEEQGEPETEDPWASYYYSPFNHVEKRDDRVVLFADDLPPGVHVSTFVARATTPGDFVLKPAKAEEMYTPEVYGRSEGGRFRVKPGKAVAKR